MVVNSRINRTRPRGLVVTSGIMIVNSRINRTRPRGLMVTSGDWETFMVESPQSGVCLLLSKKKKNNRISTKHRLASTHVSMIDGKIGKLIEPTLFSPTFCG